MPAKKKTAKKATKPAKSFEESLWDTATTAMRVSAELESEGTPQSVPEGQDKLRGSVESSDWSGATKTTRQGCPQGERGGANQYKHTAKRGSAFPDRRWRRRTPRIVRGAEDNVLSLIFLKFVSDKFEERRAELVAEGKEDYLDMVEWSGATWTTRQGCPEGERGGAHQFYTMQNVFYLPETSRWSYIQQHAKQGDIAIKIDSALTAVEKSNASLKGAFLNQFTATAYKLAKMNESAKLDEEIKTNLATLGYAQKKGVPARG